MALTAKKVYAILKRQISDMEAKLNSPVRYRGTVATADLLPLNPDIGDMYNIESKSVYGEAGMNVAWNGVVWDTMGAPIDMSLYIKSNELADWVKQQNKPTYTAEEVGALPDTTVIPSKTSDLQNDSGFLTKIPDNYLSGTDKTLSVSGQAADAKTVGDKNVELLVNILSKLDKNQGSENFGKIAGINEAGDIVPMFPVGVEYNEETNCLEFGSDQKMELNQGIGLDSTLTKTGSAADAGATGKEINSLKEDIQNIQKKFEFDIEMNMHGALNASPSDSAYINYSDDENARCSDYVDCQNFKYISAMCNGNKWMWIVAFFNADKLFLPDVSIVGEDGKRTYEAEIPESAKYVRISHYNAEIPYGAKIFFSNETIDANISDLQARVTALESPDDIYDGCEFALFKKWGLIGDSLSVGHTVSKDGGTASGRNIYYSWGQYLARRIGNTCLNFGRSGVTSKLWMDESETYCYPRLINPDNLCQAYIIALGANDSEMTLGSIADVNFTDMSQNADTEYGCYAKVINSVRNVSANVPIFLFTLPYPRNSDAKIKAINEMIRTFANDKEHFGKIFLVDLDADYNKYFETGKLEAQIGNTGWHLTSLGYLYASKVNEIALSKVIAENYNEFQDVFLLPCGKTEVLD